MSSNMYGGFYNNGRGFTSTKWASVIYTYEKEITVHGSCTSRWLAERSSISQGSALKAIDNYESGIVLPPL